MSEKEVSKPIELAEEKTEKEKETETEKVEEDSKSAEVEESKEKGQESNSEADVKPPLDESKPETLSTSTTSGKEGDTDLKPPPKPKRPLSPLEQAEQNLKDAFPTIEEKYIKAVLIASTGQLDPAFNALLYLSDPTFVPEIPEPKPVLPSRRKEKTQLQKDEELARKLAREFTKEERRSSRSQASGTGSRRSNPSGSNRRRGSHYNDYLDEERDDENLINKFVDEDLPQITSTINKNIEETRTKVSSWFGNLKKQYEENNGDGSNRQLFSAFGNNTYNSSSSRPSDDIGYGRPLRLSKKNTTNVSSAGDEEPNSLNYDFTGIQLSDKTADSSQPPTTPTAALQEDKAEKDVYGTPKKSLDVSGADRSSKESTVKSSGKKWESLANVNPEPVSGDTFLIDDSDEDDDNTVPSSKESK
ncbi:hypothetical protein PACTADRAFT_2159 [Pachysolen tannophilus NRRL Y-2460]|uniref:CUE domain-containing protein n=1 Tax=Pachysolen tannophilus NRRL Y-2460 TaxID=669874 RepID=A0A1E4TVR7_PACTA|nr:hypothetical protein PACTADRAFT_2159 [Pachysolen tannophilus NRRL Y-2460]